MAVLCNSLISHSTKVELLRFISYANNCSHMLVTQFIISMMLTGAMALWSLLSLMLAHGCYGTAVLPLDRGGNEGSQAK